MSSANRSEAEFSSSAGPGESTVAAPTTSTTTVTTAQREKILALQQRMRDRYQPLPPQLLNLLRILPRCESDPIELDPEWFYCACFLLSREWDVVKAFAMMQDVVNYRAANALDAHSQLPPAVSVRGWDNVEAIYTALGKAPRPTPGRAERIVAAVSAHLACGIHYWDKGGRPVVYVMIDSLDEPGLLNALKKNAKIGQKPADVLWEYGQHFIGVAEDLVLYQLQQHRQLAAEAEEKKDGFSPSTTNRTGFAQGLITLVMDLKGLHMGLLWKPMLDLFRDVARQLFQYYPDMVHRIIAVNAPGIVRVAFNMVKGVMPPAFQKKISFVAPQQTLAALQAEIDPQCIPAFLGGTCPCAEHNDRRVETPAERQADEGRGENSDGPEDRTGQATRQQDSAAKETHCGCCVDGYDRHDPLRQKAKSKQAKGGKDERATRKKKDHDDANPESEDDEGSNMHGAAPDGADEVATEDIALSSGQRHRRAFTLQAGETVVWEFALSHDSSDVAFAVYFVPESTVSAFSTNADALKQPSKIDHKKLEPFLVKEGEDDTRQEDAFTATEKGTLVLSWHNTRSWFKTRSVQLRVYKDSTSPPES